MRKKALLLSGSLLISIACHAQFWFGLTGGGQLNFPQYNASLRTDTFNISSKISGHVGITATYSSKGMFEVNAKLLYVNMNNRTRREKKNPFESINRVDSRTVNDFLSVPVMARLVFMKRQRIKVMLEAGPRISYWLGGKGTLISDEHIDDGIAEHKYKIKFSNKDILEIKQNEQDYIEQFVATKPNRIQYSIDFGAGLIFDVTPNQRAVIDAKYSWGHSYMAFNDGNDFVGVYLYQEDTEYRSNMVMVSLSYLFNFSELYTKRGKSVSAK